jgi:hypothetical protein
MLENLRLFEITFQLLYDGFCPVQEGKENMNIKGKKGHGVRYADCS